MQNSNIPEQPAPVLSFSTTVGGVSSLAGRTISINLKKDSFFMVGDISLTSKKYWAVVSPGMSPEYYSTIQKGLDLGYIVEGKEYIPEVDRPDGVLQEWERLIETERKSKVSVAAFKELIREGNDRNWTLGDIVRHCIKKERNGRQDPAVTKFLEQVLMYVNPYRDNPYDKEVYDDEEGKVDVSLVKVGGEVKAIGPEDTSDTPKPPKPPEGHVRGDKSPSEALDEVMEI